jgi:hypothetical protein
MVVPDVVGWIAGLHRRLVKLTTEGSEGRVDDETETVDVRRPQQGRKLQAKSDCAVTLSGLSMDTQQMPPPVRARQGDERPWIAAMKPAKRQGSSQAKVWDV